MRTGLDLLNGLRYKRALPGGAPGSPGPSARTSPGLSARSHVGKGSGGLPNGTFDGAQNVAVQEIQSINR